MRSDEQINQELEQKQDEALSLKTWLDANTDGDRVEHQVKRTELKMLLQDICDLVAELKPMLPYPLTSKHAIPGQLNATIKQL